MTSVIFYYSTEYKLEEFRQASYSCFTELEKGMGRAGWTRSKDAGVEQVPVAVNENRFLTSVNVF